MRDNETMQQRLEARPSICAKLAALEPSLDRTGRGLLVVVVESVKAARA